MRGLTLLLTLTFFLASCAPSTTNSSETPTPSAYHKITAEDAKAMMDKEDVLVLDVRTQEEYDEGHIPNTILLPNETIDDTPAELLPETDQTILVYCRSGRRSKEAAEKLLALGYVNVYDFGGIIDWPYDIVNE